MHFLLTGLKPGVQVMLTHIPHEFKISFLGHLFFSHRKDPLVLTQVHFGPSCRQSLRPKAHSSSSKGKQGNFIKSC